MEINGSMQVTKMDAAKRQIETAIRLWFFSGDPVSIHTLAAAAHQILHDLGKKRGASATLRDLPGVRPEKKNELRQLLSRYENFFKHADKDPAALLKFNPAATEMYMLDAIITYERLSHERPPILSTFKAWILMQNPQIMDEAEGKELIQSINVARKDFANFPKSEFFTEYPLLLSRLGLD